MKLNRSILIIMLMVCMTFPIIAKKRRKPLPMHELTNPASPSFVPFPYPKNRGEIIEDMLYAIERLDKPRPGVFLAGRQPEFVKIYLNLLEDNPRYSVGKIYKVKNKRAGRAHNYSWLILIEDQQGENVAGYLISASGLALQGGEITAKLRPCYLKTKDDVINILSNSIDENIMPEDIKSMEYFAFGPGSIGDSLLPTWKIKLKKGRVFYYSLHHDLIYGIKEKKNWKVESDGYHENWRPLIPKDADDFVFDSLDDKIIILKKYKRKKK